MMVRPLLAAFALVLLSGFGTQAAEWNVESGKSRLGFVGNQGGAPFEGSFSRWSAKIDFDPANPAAGSAVVEIDMTSAATGDKSRDEALPQGEWFDAKAFPKARFEAKSFRAKGGNAYEAVGTLGIRNIKKDVVLPFTLDTTGTSAHAKGRLELIRTDYGVGQGAFATPQMVALEVAVVLDIQATRKP
ncbi:YceI family protein [Candidatus Terasakiella magnetica]|nr:YceI family protein [Candidatus Terasakiella magnetica]